MIVLPETPLLGAFAAAERMRRLCAETQLEIVETKLAVTASFGIATIDGVAASNADADAMLRAADEALYESKRAGRNRVTCGPRSPMPAAPTPALPTAPTPVDSAAATPA